MNKMNIKGLLINDYTVGGSLLLVGAGFFSTRFTDALSYELFTLPAGIPMVGGASVTVGRVAGLVPLSLGVAFLLGKIRPVTSRVPVVDKVADVVDNLVSEVSMPVSEETSKMGADHKDTKCAEHEAEDCSQCNYEADTVDQINPTEVEADSDSFEAESSGKMKWTDAVSKARADLGIEGFTPVKKGTELYNRAKSYMN
tara:strand:- start:1182 stop:1778 length:597 start_codon:yes stop_codon:yes gene_type:complete